MLFSLLAVAASAAFAAAAPTAPSPLAAPTVVTPDGDRLVRVATPTSKARADLDALGLDVWTEHPGPHFVDVRVRANRAAWLDASGLDYVVLSPDLGPAVRDERERLAARTPYHHGGGTEAFFDDFQPLASIEVRLNELAELGGVGATAQVLGASFEGRSIVGLEVTETEDDEAPVVLLNAGQHAREWVSISSAMCVADRLVTQAQDPRVSALLSEVRFAVVPVVNPDGYVFSWTENRLWRKNRRPPDGVDTNRNFGVAWGGPGSSGNPEAGNYRGEAPFSEPEAHALRDYAQGFPSLAGHIDVHAYGQLVLYPWGFQEEEPAAIDTLREAAEIFEAGLREPWATDYTAIPGAALYPAAGNAMDWSFGELGTFALGVELRPDGEQDPPNDGFVLPPEQILPVCDEVWEATLNFAEFVAAQTGPGPGDDGRASADASTGVPGDDSRGDDTLPTAESSSTSGAGVGTGGEASATRGDTTTGTDAPAGSDDTTPADTAAGNDDNNSGCACQAFATQRRTPSPQWLGVLVLGLFGLRRRRRVST